MALIATSPSPAATLRPDRFGRLATKLRIQLTDACNLRCLYCMGEDATFLPREDLLTPRELGRLSGSLRDLGIVQARITGGEPTLRSDFLDCVEAIAAAGWERLGLTTNGLRLAGLAKPLADLGLHGANVSLDSLDADNFRRIARRPGLSEVLRGIDAARAAGLRVKINCVVMAGVNDHELLDFAAFSAREGIEVRFLEAMKVGPLASATQDPLVPSATLRLRLREALGEPVVPAVEPDATATLAHYASGARLGFVSSETEPFCGGCSRLRLSATGTLRACLFRKEGVSLRDLPPEAIPNAVQSTLARKPEGRLASVSEGMNAIGG
jgi:cyclic pyranopterin phosphate synthase